MSNILRRPMFRGGGKVSSYGNGIASGLAKPKRGLVDEPGGYAGENFLISQGLYDEFLRGKPVGTSTTTGGNILSQNIRPMQGPLLSPQMQAIQDRLNPQPKSVMGRTIGQRLLDTGGRFVGRFPALSTTGLIAAAFAPVGIMAAANAPETVEALVYMKKMNESGIFDETSDPKAVNEYYETLEKLNKTGTRLEEKGVGLATSKEDLEKIINELNAPPPPPPPGGGGGGGEETNMNTEEPELTVNDYIDLLGGKQARRRDIGDMLGRASAAFLKRPARGETRGITEALGDFMETETAAGPGRREKIEQTAAMLDIKDRQATKRALEQVDLMKAQEIFRRDISKGTIDDLYLAAKKTEGVPAAVAYAIKNTLPGYDNKEFEVVEAKDAEKRQLTESDIGKVIIRGNKSGTYTALEVIKKPDGTIDTKKIYTSL
jgi:hypothetical protein